MDLLRQLWDRLNILIISQSLYFVTAQKEVDAKVAEMAQDIEDGVEPSGFLSCVIASHQLSPGEIYATLSEIMTASVDTVCN